MIVQAQTHAQPNRYRFSVDEYMQMGEIGMFRHGPRVELLDGEVITMSPIGPAHAYIVDALNEIIPDQVRGICVVRVQGPIWLNDDSMPEPDFAVLRTPRDKYAQSHPKPGDVPLLIEVAQSSFDYDRNEKLPRYAKAEIPEVWIGDVEGQSIEQYTLPHGERYSQLAGTANRFKRPGLRA